MSLILGSRLAGDGPPGFQASLDGEPAIVELDSGAIFKLARRATHDELDRILEEKRERIGDAAIRLAREGFVTRGDRGAEILVTALDL
ncbi:hypothetical protein ACFSTI_21460 [Rhizorhabdus histidinilytica]|jgi:hypothetical protein|uniref:Uncharacterized protein n=1 Tax=Rhizorhabdus histidinilytica TaxID=439228 RepID=A0A1T5BIY1_9SPHN|nr:hypothetical protein [Rhizorhabdus histidinilytica]QEH77599.1 hypothetical protein EIK56_05225 [Sphingomonas sp. C8-2]SKB46969.1 hypothetical protein SAMN06295920_10339 [Rhizorhabdus histidinilytica]